MKLLRLFLRSTAAILMLAFLHAMLLAAEPPKREPVYYPTPKYPPILRQNRIGGTVNIQILVTPAGTVKSATLIGGNPVLAEYAMEAVRHWKYAPGPNTTVITVEVEFKP